MIPETSRVCSPCPTSRPRRRWRRPLLVMGKRRRGGDESAVAPPAAKEEERRRGDRSQSSCIPAGAGKGEYFSSISGRTPPDRIADRSPPGAPEVRETGLAAGGFRAGSTRG